jgi:hypothetical protein
MFTMNNPGAYPWHILPRQIDSTKWMIHMFHHKYKHQTKEAMVDTQPLKEPIQLDPYVDV